MVRIEKIEVHLRKNAALDARAGHSQIHFRARGEAAGEDQLRQVRPGAGGVGRIVADVEAVEDQRGVFEPTRGKLLDAGSIEAKREVDMRAERAGDRRRERAEDREDLLVAEAEI